MLFFRPAQFCEHGKIFERGRVAGDGFTAGDFFQQSPHDFSAAGFWQRFGEAHFVRFRNRTDLCADVIAKQLLQLRRQFYSALNGDESDHSLTFQLVRSSNHRRLGHIRVTNERALDFRGPKPVPGDVQHVIDAADDPKVAVFIATGAVAGKIVSVNSLQYCFL